MDWFVILGPLLALGVLSLLGFAGCGFEGQAGPAEPTLYFRLRVPAERVVEQAGFVHDGPMTGRTEVTMPTESTEPGPPAFKVFRHSLSSPDMGDWDVTAATRVASSGDPVLAEATRRVMFPSDGTSWRVDFEASGDPDAGTFGVAFIDFVQV